MADAHTSVRRLQATRTLCEESVHDQRQVRRSRAIPTRIGAFQVGQRGRRRPRRPRAGFDPHLDPGVSRAAALGGFDARAVEHGRAGLDQSPLGIGQIGFVTQPFAAMPPPSGRGPH